MISQLLNSIISLFVKPNLPNKYPVSKKTYWNLDKDFLILLYKSRTTRNKEMSYGINVVVKLSDLDVTKVL